MQEISSLLGSSHSALGMRLREREKKYVGLVKYSPHFAPF